MLIIIIRKTKPNLKIVRTIIKNWFGGKKNKCFNKR
jgi:hypothetical protein